MLRPHANGGCTSGDTRNDRHGVSRLDGRVALRQVPDVAIVHVHVDEAAQAAVVGKQVAFEPGVLAREALEQLADVAAFQLERVAAADVGAQRRGNQYRDCHTAFRSSMVIDSSANVPRSSASTQLFGSPARPAPTPTVEAGGGRTRAVKSASAATMAAPVDHPTNSPASLAKRRTASSASSVATNSVRLGSTGS